MAWRTRVAARVALVSVVSAANKPDLTDRSSGIRAEIGAVRARDASMSASTDRRRWVRPIPHRGARIFRGNSSEPRGEQHRGRRSAYRAGRSTNTEEGKQGRPAAVTRVAAAAVHVGANECRRRSKAQWPRQRAVRPVEEATSGPSDARPFARSQAQTPKKKIKKKG